MNDVAGIRTVSGRTILARLGAEAGAVPVSLERALEVGREVGAGSVVTGGVTAVGGQVRLAGQVPDGRRWRSAVVGGGAGRGLFSPPDYEVPNDPVFETTGVLQVVPAAMAARHLARIRSARPGALSR